VPFGFPHQGLISLPPSLAAFCPWEPSTLVYVGFGMQKEALFYSLRKKQVFVPCQARLCSSRAMATSNEVQWGEAVLPCA